MTLCPHGYVHPCWMCDGLHECDYVRARLALLGEVNPPNSKQCTAWYALPPDVEPRRNQDVPSSASAGDYYVSQRGRVWLLCARGPNWSLVQAVDALPPEALARARELSSRKRASKRDRAFAAAKGGV